MSRQLHYAANFYILCGFKEVLLMVKVPTVPDTLLQNYSWQLYNNLA